MLLSVPYCIFEERILRTVVNIRVHRGVHRSYIAAPGSCTPLVSWYARRTPAASTNPGAWVVP